MSKRNRFSTALRRIVRKLRGTATVTDVAREPARLMWGTPGERVNHSDEPPRMIMISDRYFFDAPDPTMPLHPMCGFIRPDGSTGPTWYIDDISDDDEGLDDD